MNKNDLIDRCDALYIWHKEQVYKMALKAVGGDREWALEILDICMMRVYHYIDKFEDVQSERSKSIVAAVFQSVLNDIYRKAWNKSRISDGYCNPMHTQKDRLNVDQILIRNEHFADLAKHVEELSHAEKELIFFRFFMGMTEGEICRHFNIGPEEADARLFLAKQKISKLIVEGQ